MTSRNENAVEPRHRHEQIFVWVMLPLDTVNSESVFKLANAPWFARALSLLRNSGVKGVSIDCWWGAVERTPGHYSWTGYRQLLDMVKQAGLKMQVVMSFHACGGNTGDSATISLPPWVLQAGEQDPDLFFTHRPRNDSPGKRNKEYISIWASNERLLCGRSAYECYEEFMRAFKDTFQQELGTTIEEVVVGTGPCGELRYPSYPECHGWRFPGIGEFQCYDRRALASLASAANEAGHPEWGYGGPHDAGHYNSKPEETGFFKQNGAWGSDYGRFFLEWYSSCLLKHGERLLQIATSTFESCGVVSHVASQPASASNAVNNRTQLQPLGNTLNSSQEMLPTVTQSLSQQPVTELRLPPEPFVSSISAQDPTTQHLVLLGVDVQHAQQQQPFQLQPVGGQLELCEAGTSSSTINMQCLADSQLAPSKSSTLSASVSQSAQSSQVLTCDSATPTSTCTAPLSQDANLVSSSSGSCLCEPVVSRGVLGAVNQADLLIAILPTLTQHITQQHQGVLSVVSGVDQEPNEAIVVGVPSKLDVPQKWINTEQGYTSPSGLHTAATTTQQEEVLSLTRRSDSASSTDKGQLNSLSVATKGLSRDMGSSGKLQSATGMTTPIHRMSSGILLPASPYPAGAERPHVSMCGAPSMTLVSSVDTTTSGTPNVPMSPLQTNTSLAVEPSQRTSGTNGCISPHILRLMSCSSIPSVSAGAVTPTAQGYGIDTSLGTRLQHLSSHGASHAWAVAESKELCQEASVIAPPTPSPLMINHAHSNDHAAPPVQAVGAACDYMSINRPIVRADEQPATQVYNSQSLAQQLPTGQSHGKHEISPDNMGRDNSSSNMSASTQQRSSMDDVSSQSTLCNGLLQPSSCCTQSSSDQGSLQCTSASKTSGITIALKIPGVHWWYKSQSHAAELTAGYYNAANRDGYEPLVKLCAKYGAALTLTCVEMCDAQHPSTAACSPEGLLKQIRTLTARYNVKLGGENALPIFLGQGVDTVAMDRVVINTRAWYGPSTCSAAADQHRYLLMLQQTQQQAVQASLGRGTQLTHHVSLPGVHFPPPSPPPGLSHPRHSYSVGYRTSSPSPVSILQPQEASSQGFTPLITEPLYNTSWIGSHGSSSSRRENSASAPYGCYYNHGGNGYYVEASNTFHDPPGLPRSLSGARTPKPSSFQTGLQFPLHNGGAVPLYGGLAAGYGYSVADAGSSCLHGGISHHHRLESRSANQVQDLVNAASTSCSVEPGTSRSCSAGGSGAAAALPAPNMVLQGGLLGLPGQQHGVAACGLRMDSYEDISEPLQAMRSFTFLRLGPELLLPGYQVPWLKFMAGMQMGGYEAT